jgi:dTDP-4-dehydrorhamnose reductase
MRIHVTGGTGYLGSELVCRAGDVTAGDVTAERVEIRDAGAVRSLFGRVRPDVVIHTAYVQKGPEAWEVTVDGAAHVAAAAHEVGARLLHLSTDVVFDGRKRAPYVEADEPSPASEYGRAKAESERRVLSAHPGALVVRTSLIFGGPGHEPSKHERMAFDPDIVFFEDEIRCPIQVGDLAAALLELAGLEFTGIVHVAGPDALSRADLAELVTGAPVRRAPAPAGRPLDCRLDCSRALALLTTELRGARSVLATAFPA